MFRKKLTILRNCILIGVVSFIVYGFHSTLITTHYTVESLQLPNSFDNYKIVLLSDLHGANFGNHQKDLIAAITQATPDLIVFVGDMIDEKHSDLTYLSDLLRGIEGVAPIYSTPGNHEFVDLTIYQAGQALYKEYGVTELTDHTIEIKKGKESILLHGLHQSVQYSTQTLPVIDNTKFSILLYHYSDTFDIMSKSNYNLILSGHVHGGIIRLPFLGGLLGPDRWFFPKYDKGVFYQNDTILVSTSGLGESTPPRFNNRPEVVVVTLQKK